MLHTRLPASVFRPQPPPLWYVSNGHLTVGPVDTTLLVRGVEYGRVPEDCHVRPARGDWRQLLGIREIAAMNGNAANGVSFEQLTEWSRFMLRLRDEDELYHTATWLCMRITGAERAMLHASGRNGGLLFTRSVLGPVANRRVGYPLSGFDPVLRAARRKSPVQGPPYGPLENMLTKRLATAQTGGAVAGGAVAMIPFFVGGQLAAMLELARAGHAFRCSDLQQLERIVQRALELHFSVEVSLAEPCPARRATA